MVDYRDNCVIYEEMKADDEVMKYWFDFKQRKFLHNIDTFYYSVKLGHDFTKHSKDNFVLKFREHFDKLRPDVPDYELPVDFGQSMQLNLKSGRFGYFYDIRLTCPEYFDIFMASIVPASYDSEEDGITSEIIVQIRSCLLWELGVCKAFEYSYACIVDICRYFNFEIKEVKENRIDYCWHSNYHQNPEVYFRPDNFNEMMVSRIGRSKKEPGIPSLFRFVFHPGEYYENDYIAIGKRNDKIFLRIYQKTKEVIQMGTKPWFLKIWLFHNLINRYDFYCYEEAYAEKKWHYVDVGRLKFYQEFGKNDFYKSEINTLLNAKVLDFDRIAQLANLLTPKVHIIVNVEFQTTRKHSKNYMLLPLKDNDKYGVCKRIYSYFDNHKLITEYLTHEAFRLIDVKTDTNRSRCDYNAFWKALRNTKLVDVLIPPDELKLYRDYSRVLNADLVKRRAANCIVTHSLYQNGLNSRNVMDDVVDFIVMLNDNDIMKMKQYKENKKLVLNNTELGDKPVSFPESRYLIIDKETGEVITGGDVEGDTGISDV